MLKNRPSQPSAEKSRRDISVLDSLLDREVDPLLEDAGQESAHRVSDNAAVTEGRMCEAVIAAWSGSEGRLSDGQAVRLAVSCLVRPQSGDVVLLWKPAVGDAAVALAVLRRSHEDSGVVVGSSNPLSIEAPVMSLVAGDLNVSARNILTNATNHHSVEDTRTQTNRLRVTQVETDVRKAGTVEDSIEGGFIQRLGEWISTTTKEARLRARTFMFD